MIITVPSDVKAIVTPFGLALLRRLPFPHKLGILDRIYGRRLARCGTCWIETSSGLVWKLDLRNPTLRWIVYGDYEGGGFLKWARVFLSRDAVIVDSGANIGQMLLYLARYAANGKTLAFEPNEHAANWLTECLAQNSFLPVELIRKGLGAAQGVLYLQDSGPPEKHGSQSTVSESDGTPIQISRLCDELAKRGINVVDLWKMDMEGYEEMALRGAEDLLRSKRIRAIYAETMGEPGKQTRKYLEASGYAPFEILNNGCAAPLSPSSKISNVLFLPN